MSAILLVGAHFTCAVFRSLPAYVFPRARSQFSASATQHSLCTPCFYIIKFRHTMLLNSVPVSELETLAFSSFMLCYLLSLHISIKIIAY